MQGYHGNRDVKETDEETDRKTDGEREGGWGDRVMIG